MTIIYGHSLLHKITKTHERTKKMRRNHFERYEEITVREAFNLFIKEKISENLSNETLKTYTLHISHFLNKMMLAHLPTRQLDKSHYLDWIILLKRDSKKNDVTVASYCRSVRAFYYWLQNNDYMEYVQLKIPKYQQTIKKCYTDTELTALLKKPVFDSEVEYRTWILINLVCATGIRIRSALNIHVNDIIPDDSLIYIQVTKNNKGQVLYLNDTLLNLLTGYVQNLGLSETDYLICNFLNRKLPLSKKTAQENLVTFNHKHGVQKTSIHLMRHTFAKNFYAHTHDIYTLSQLLGHSSISVTEVYLRDLGVAPERATAYNPQELYAKK